MSTAEVREPTVGLQRRLGAAKSQLAWYARDLLDNALRFSQEQKSIRVEVRATVEKVTLTRADCGQEFPPGLALELFQLFIIADAMHHSRRTGFNLRLRV